jgi:WD40 repeat protein
VAWTLGTAEFRHGGSVTCLRFSPDGESLVSGSRDGTLGLWDLRSGERLRTFRLPGLPVRDAVFSEDGRAVTAEGDLYPCYKFPQFRIVRWEAGSGRVLKMRARSWRWIDAAAVSRDGLWWVLAVDHHVNQEYGAIRVLDPAGGSGILRRSGSVAATAVAIASGGRGFAAGNPDGTVRIWRDPGQAEPIFLEAPAGPVRTLRYDASGRRLVSGSEDGIAAVWDTRGGERLALLRGHEGAVCAAALSGDGRGALTAGSDGTLRWWRVGDATELRRIEAGLGPLSAAALTPDGSSVACGSHTGRMGIWGLEEGVEMTPPAARTPPCLAIDLSPDGILLAAAIGSEVAIRSLPTGEVCGTLSVGKSPAVLLRFSPHGRLLAAATADGSLACAGLGTGQWAWRTEAGDAPPGDLSWSPDGSLLLCVHSGSKLLEVRDAASGTVVRGFPLGEDRGTATFVRGGSLVRWCGRAAIRTWDLVTGQLVSTVEGDFSTFAGNRFVRGGNGLVCDGLGRLRVIAAGTGEKLFETRARSSMTAPPRSAVTPDGRWAVLGSGPRFRHLAGTLSGSDVLLVSLTDPERKIVLESGVRVAERVGFGPGGRIAYAVTRDYASVDRVIKVWTVPEGRLLGRLFVPGLDYRDVRIAPSGRRMVTRNSDGTIFLIEIR